MKEKLNLVNTPIWERQPGEPPKRYMWFTRYRDLRLEGGSLRDLCEKYGKKIGYWRVLQQWSSLSRWVERVEAYRDFLEGEKQRQRLKDIEEMGERQAKNGVLLQQYGIAWFVAHPDIGAKGDGITPEVAMKFIETGSKLERTARGAPTEIRAEGELPEEVRKKMQSIYAEAIEEAGPVKPEDILEQTETDEDSEDKG